MPGVSSGDVVEIGLLDELISISAALNPHTSYLIMKCLTVIMHTIGAYRGCETFVSSQHSWTK